jgi:hypothetical protein
MSSTTTFTFPYATLTPIDGKPTNTTLQLLQRQLFTNARAVDSPCGGGAHGHLAILLSNVDYLRRAGMPFIVPIHPGAAPGVGAGTGAQLSAAIPTYNQAMADVTLYNRLSAALTAQILSAVNASFLSALEDPNFGFGDVPPLAMLTHLKRECGTMTPEQLESNCAALSDSWNLDNPIEDLWAKIANIQRVAVLGQVPIPDITVITLTLAMFEKTGLLATTTENFRLLPAIAWTLDRSKADFKLGSQERISKLSAGTAGFHGAHLAIVVTPPPTTATAAAATASVPAPELALQHVSVEGGKMYNCWTHGLSPHRNHTSATCIRKAAGHQADATAFNMKGGNNTISAGRARQLPTSTRA